MFSLVHLIDGAVRSRPERTASVLLIVIFSLVFSLDGGAQTTVSALAALCV